MLCGWLVCFNMMFDGMGVLRLWLCDCLCIWKSVWVGGVVGLIV